MYILYDSYGTIFKAVKQCADINKYIELNNYTEYHLIETNESIGNLSWYKIMNGTIVKRTNEGINEYITYGRELTSNERLLNQLKPSHDEVKKAELTIEVFSVLEGLV